MSTPPARPRIYHITHVDNLASVVNYGLLCDTAMIARGGPDAGIGMSHIKERRLHLPVSCHPGDTVGDYVPFYLCPRSLMLYVIFRGNHPELRYRDGQEPIVHLEADLHAVVRMGGGRKTPLGVLFLQCGNSLRPFLGRRRRSGPDRLERSSRRGFQIGGYQGRETGRISRTWDIPLESRLAHRCYETRYRCARTSGDIERRSSARDRYPAGMVLLSSDGGAAVIDIQRGSIIAADTEALVNTVNCVGVMGKGIALQFREAFPNNFRAFKSACERGEIQLGKVFLYETGSLTNPRYIINFPTKGHWRNHSRLADIEKGMESLVAEVGRLGIRSIAIPPLGCGLGGLQWAEVRPRIERAMQALPNVRAVVFEPSRAPELGASSTSTPVPTMTPGRAALVGLIHRYLSGLLEPSVSLLEVHKMMYFLQEAGQPLRLEYRKAYYGPYAENLRHVLEEVEGHFLIGYRGDESPKTQIELMPEVLRSAESILVQHSDLRMRFDRVVDLVQGFETPFGLELLATVHWVAQHERAATVDQAIERTYAWNKRKRRFEPSQIEIAWDTLSTKGWLPAKFDLSV